MRRILIAIIFLASSFSTFAQVGKMDGFRKTGNLRVHDITASGDMTVYGIAQFYSSLLIDLAGGEQTSWADSDLDSVLVRPGAGGNFGANLFKIVDNTTKLVEIDTLGRMALGDPAAWSTLTVVPDAVGEGYAVRESDDGNVAGKLIGWTGGGQLTMYASGAIRISIDAATTTQTSYFNAGPVAFGGTTALANSVTLGSKATQRDLLVTRENVPAGTDSSWRTTINAGIAESYWLGATTNRRTIIDNKSIGIYAAASTDTGFVYTNDKDATKDSIAYISSDGSIRSLTKSVAAISGTSNSQVGIYGSSTSNYGLYGISISEAAIRGASTTGLGGYVSNNTTTTNTAINVFRIDRSTSGTAANNIGASMDIYVESAGGNISRAGRFAAVLTNASAGSETSSINLAPISSGGSFTDALVVSNALVEAVGDLKITGNDLFMTTNTLGAVLVADGTNYNPVVMSGDAVISSAGIVNNGIWYVAKDGNDSNTGTKASPLLTITAALGKSPLREIHIKEGIYREDLNIAKTVGSLKITGYSTGEELTSPVVYVWASDSLYNWSSSGSGVWQTATTRSTSYPYIWESDSLMIKGQSLANIKSADSTGYFYYDNAKDSIYIHPFFSMDITARHEFDWRGQTLLAFASTRINTDFIDVSNIEFGYGYYIITFADVAKALFSNCVFTHPTGGINVEINEASTVEFINCISEWNPKNDGFSIKEGSKARLTDCEANYNYDEGISSHDSSNIWVYGGRYKGNGWGMVAGGGSSYGGVNGYGKGYSYIYNVISDSNATYGISIIGYGGTHTGVVTGCKTNQNGDVGIYSESANVTGYNNASLQEVILSAAATTFGVISNNISVDGDVGGNTIATITGGQVGIYTFEFIDASVTISHNGSHTANTIDLDGASSFISAANKTLTMFFDGISWYWDADWNTEAELQAAWGSVNILLETEIDASSELAALIDDETGTAGNLVFSTLPTFAAWKSTDSTRVYTTSSNSNSPASWLVANNAGAEVKASWQMMYGADPYIRLAVADTGAGAIAVSPVLDIKDDGIFAVTDNKVDIGGVSDNRPRNINIAGNYRNAHGTALDDVATGASAASSGACVITMAGANPGGNTGWVPIYHPAVGDTVWIPYVLDPTP